MLAACSPLHSAVRISSALVLVAVSLALAVVVPAVRADAAVIRPFTTVFSQQTNGAIQITGNTMMTCGTATACTQAQSGASNASNNNFTMTYLDVDSDASTTRSSSANLTIPTGGRVLYAGLFWGAARNAGNSGSAAAGTPGNIRFRAPGASTYTTLAADRIDNQTTGNLDYSAYRDVTSIVQGAGAGTYWGADIAAATGVDRYAGWSLVVAVEDPSAPLRDLTVFSGYATVTNNDVIDTSISGFLAPPSGAVGAKFGGVTYEGDYGITGDYFQVNSTRLADSLSPSANFFSSRISANGSNITNRNPSWVNTLSQDSKVVDAPGVVPNGATSANLRFATSGDFYYPAALTTQIDLYAPTIQGSKSVTNLSGNSPAKVGDVLEYAMTFSNIGDDAATNAVITDPIPADTTFVPGSVRVTAGANQGTKTDATGDDQAEYVAASRTVRVRAGTGANATAGGRLAPSATTTVTFRVRVDSAAAGTTLSNTASLAYRAETIGRDYSYNTAPVTTPVADEADVALTKTASPEPVAAGNQITYTLTATNNGPNPAAGVRISDPLSPGVTYVSSNPSSGSCSLGGQTLTCDLGTMANGATVTVPVVVRVPPGSSATSITNVAAISTTTSDPVPANNTASASSTVVRQADLALTKSAAPTNPVPGTDVTYTVVATNNGASRAVDVTVTDTLPAGLAVRSATGPQGTCTVTGSQVSCAAGALDPGQSATFTVVARVPSDAGTAPLTNTALVTSGTPDPTAANNSGSATITPAARRADLAVAKQAVTPVVAGRPLQYLVTVTNNGPSDAATVTLADPLPPSITGISATSNAGSCTVSDGTVSCAFGSLPSGQSVQVRIDGQLAPGATGTLLNTAAASTSTTDPTPGNDQATASDPIATSADLALTKTADDVADGAEATYTLVVTNNGPSVARSVTVSDPVPAPLVHNGSSSTQGSCSFASGTVTCDVGDIPVGDTVTITVRAQTPADGSGRGASNTATVSSPTPDPTAANNSATYVLPTTSQADVSLAKSVSPNPVVAGQQVTYTITARNNGPSDATGVTVTDQVPARVSGVSATATNGASCAATTGNAVSCTSATLASGASFTVTVTGTVAPGAATGPMGNTATVTSTTPVDPTPSNNSATASTDVVARADVSVTKTGPAEADAGARASWVLTVTNNGPSSAANLVLTDALPSGVTFASSTSVPAGVTCTAADGLVTCPVGDLASGASVEVTVRADIASGLADGTSLTNTGGVSSSTPDPTPGNNTATSSTDVTESSDVRIAKTSDPATLVPGAESSYLLAVTNDGPSDARDVVVTDTLDTDLTVLEATIEGGTCDVTGQLVTCTRALLPVDATTTARIRVLVAPERQAPLDNTAEVASASDTTPGNNSGTLSSDVAPSADLTVTKTASRDRISAGEGVTYTLTVVDNGPSLAADVTLTDTMPAGIVPAAATATAGSCAITGQLVECDLGDVAPGAPVTVTITASTAPGATAGARDNTATVTSATADPAPGNDAATATVTIGAEADVQLTKLANSDTFVPGRQVGWSIVVNNLGPSTARGVVVTDTLPDAVTITAAFHGTATPCSVAGQVVTCDLGDRVPGQRVITIVGTLASGYTGSTLANTARAATTSTDPVPGNDTATATTGIVRQTDLEIVKTIDDPTPVAGQRITYTLSAYNNGPSDALDPQFIDQLPSGLVDVVVNRPTLLGQPATAACELRPPTDPGTADNPTAPTVFCDGPVFRAGLPQRVIGSIEATVAPGFTGSLTNTARISSDTIDIDAANNESTVTTAVTADADVSITKAVAPSAPVPGEPVTWTVVVTNDGPSIARDVVVTDDVEDDITGVTATTGTTPEPCAIAAGNDVTCDLGDLAPGSSVTVTLRGDVPAGFTGDLDNTATVTSPTDDTPGNNTATAASTTGPRANVGITKTVFPTRPVPGQEVTYTLDVSNSGPSVARSVEVADAVPDALSGVTATSAPTADRCTVAGNQVDCDLGDLAPDEPVTITVRGALAPGFTGDLVNTATVRSPTDTTPGNNTATASGSTDPQADVSVTKSVSPIAPVPGEDVTYTVVVTNNGPSAARGVTLEDDLADELTDLQVSTGVTPDPCTIESGNDVSCAFGDLAASGAASRVVVTITGGLPAGFTGDLDNTVFVDSVTDSTPANNTATADATVAPRADVSITKSLTPDPPVPGRPLTYTLVVTNNGPSVARDVEVSDDVDDAVTGLVADGPGCDVAGGNDVTCDLGDLAPGTSTTITLTGGLPAGFTGDLDNTATVTSPTDTTPGNNTATVSGTAAPDANVGVTKVVAPSNPVPGEDVTWTIVVGNTGPSVARDVIVRDDVDDAITGLTATTGATPNPCTIAAGNDVTCALGDLRDGERVVITLGGGVPADFTGDLDNTATVSSPTDSTPANNTATANPATAPGADLSIIKTATPADPVPGTDVTWTVTITNAGPSVARDVVITDDVLDALTDVTASAPCTVGAGNAVTCELGDVGVGGVDATRTVTITGSVPPAYTGDVDNTATVASPTDTNTANNSSATQGTAEPSADLSITKTATPAVPVPGTEMTWTLTVTNAGPSVATGVVVRDDVADALTGVSASSDRSPEPCSVASGNVVTCPVPTMAVGATLTVTITGRLPADFTGDLDNTATVSSPVDDRTGNNSASTSGTATPQADVSITKTMVPTAPVPGRAVTWTLVVGNAGPSVARDVVVTDDVLDAVTDLTASDPCVIADDNEVTCELGDLGPGTTRTLTLGGGLPAGYTGPVDNTATVASPTDDTDTDNNSSSTGGVATPEADVSITKTMVPPVPVPGQDVTWTIGVVNAGPSVARAVEVTDDVLDAVTGLTATTGTTPNPCTIAAGNVVTCALGDLGPANTATITLTGRLDPDHAGTVDNTASVESETDTTPGNNEATTSGDTGARADVSVTKTLDPARPVPGQEVSWTVRVANTGPSTARSVVLTDDVDDAVGGLVATSGTSPEVCRIATGNQVTCDIGQLAPGETRVVTIRGTLDADFTGQLSNTARVASPTDSTPANDVATVVGEAAPQVDLSITKAAASRRAAPGSKVTFTITVANAGPSTARDVEVVDELERRLVLLSTDVTTGAADLTTRKRRVTAVFATLRPGEDGVVRIVTRLADDATGTVRNVAVATSPSPGGGEVEVQDVVDVQVAGQPEEGDVGDNGDDDTPQAQPDDDGVLPDTGLPAGVVPLAALSVLLLALGLWMMRRSRVSGRPD
ncbi:hypothetical protein [uncultured Nocardioides sp.]|uniref:hypothetical protein n=1 Tax=uncultured Nocardioides sp. TaxID=198441 RepID=UPI00261EFBAC|nr:hypothetical protein [uncultured Nocardioides sp.]